MNLIEDLKWRGLLADCTDIQALEKRLEEGPITLYCGFDPTGDSLHVGHLMGQLTLRRFQRAGHHPIALAGGATGMIGDPSGKSAERNLLTREQLQHNVAAIKGQLSRLLDFNATDNPARLVDNADWTAPMGFLDFLRDVGKHFPLTAMLAKDSVRTRMEGEAGISYTEFSYQLLQAYDFYHLRREMGCELQIGGSDQWGNITAGTDFVRRKLGVPVWGWTFPLITKADGSKFGKTESGAVWLDPARTSPYRFYQFFLNTEDAKVGEYLRKFTFLDRAEIEALEVEHAANPGARQAQRRLAEEVTRLVHGQAALDAAVKASAILFGAEIGDIDSATFQDVVGEVPTRALAPERLEGDGAALVELLVDAGLCPSKGQARKDIDGGGIYVNNQRCQDAMRMVAAGDLLFGRYLLLRKGKKSYAVLDAG
ncbi:tyrosine--tRNA ligase [Pseudofulvimonas gallinarii]|jgi:tyrosyl-tRNA synthetase|uniref:Tyrosine--tRNA ligase n=1 Tax=Pseudofulvimonas gallinarii TaxID=634155 RepID=A0A4R3LS71_9GAMM|nr:tyrosine--tRNA ligase [Pseudofulvimonas gallinarii]TCT01425.1 tyrosyl-tRNA synthetase [Pseudofulvimonas gallinarii]THD12587.1 tyrosine--tRNA ligase [Pseudofulvimonas gallinarii]